MKFKRFTKLLPSTKPLIKGCNCSQHNFDLIDEIDRLGLSRERALKVDENGELYKVENWREMKLTVNEMNDLKNEYDNFFNVDHSKRRFDNCKMLY